MLFLALCFNNSIKILTDENTVAATHHVIPRALKDSSDSERSPV